MGNVCFVFVFCLGSSLQVWGFFFECSLQVWFFLGGVLCRIFRVFSAGLGLFFWSVLFGVFSVFFAGLGILSVFCRMFQGCSLQVWGVFFECSVQDVSGCSLQVWGCCLECSLQDVLRCSLQVWGFFGVFLSVLCRIFSVFSAGLGLLSGLFFFF